MCAIRNITSAVAAGFGLALLVGCSPPGREVYVTNEDGHYVLKMMPCERGTIGGVSVFDIDAPMKTAEYGGRLTAWWAASLDKIGTRELTLFEANPKYEIFSDYHWDTVDNFELIAWSPDRPAAALQGRLKELKPDEALTQPRYRSHQ